MLLVFINYFNIFSSAGSVHDEAIKVVNFIADLRGQRFGIPKAMARRNLLDKISVAIHIGNARCILKTMAIIPSCPPLLLLHHFTTFLQAKKREKIIIKFVLLKQKEGVFFIFRSNQRVALEEQMHSLASMILSWILQAYLGL